MNGKEIEKEKCSHTSWGRRQTGFGDGIEDSRVFEAYCNTCNKVLCTRYENISATWNEIYDRDWAKANGIDDIEYQAQLQKKKESRSKSKTCFSFSLSFSTTTYLNLYKDVKFLKKKAIHHVAAKGNMGEEREGREGQESSELQTNLLA